MVGDKTRHVHIVGLEVRDEHGYGLYRAGMTPILETYGGAFGYDFVVSRVLKSETTKSINRVFTIVFPDESASERFFSDPAYLAVRAEHFEPSVGSVTRIGSYDETVPSDQA